MKLIPAARLYKVVLPEADAMAKHLATVPHEPLQPSAYCGSGFVAAPFTDSLVHSFPGGYAFTLRYDEKIVPSAVVNALVAERAVEFQEREGHAPGRKARREMREEAFVDLCCHALTNTKTITAYYNTTEELLVIPTTARKLCDTITGQMVRAVESVESKTIHVAGVKNSITGKLLVDLTECDGFGEFEVGGRCKLVGIEGEKFSFDLAHLDSAREGILEALGKGSKVVEIALSHGGVSFRLADDFSLKGIKFAGIELGDIADVTEEYLTEASTQLLMLSAVVKELCEMFGYKPIEEDLLG